MTAPDLADLQLAHAWCSHPPTRGACEACVRGLPPAELRGVGASEATAIGSAPWVLGYFTTTVMLDASSWGAEETAPDDSKRVVCRCGHATQAEAEACGRGRAMYARARAAYEAHRRAYLGPEAAPGMTPFSDLCLRDPREARAWVAVVLAGEAGR